MMITRKNTDDFNIHHWHDAKQLQCLFDYDSSTIKINLVDQFGKKCELVIYNVLCCEMHLTKPWFYATRVYFASARYDPDAIHTMAAKLAHKNTNDDYMKYHDDLENYYVILIEFISGDEIYILTNKTDISYDI
jgi:hypothetical protein